MKEILCSISTRGRYHTTLPTVLFAVINQTTKPDHIIIFDDNDPDKRIDIREIEIFRHALTICDMLGIGWEIIFGECKGQHFNHHIANNFGFKWVWRVDDDVVPKSNVLENLYKHTNDSIGAVGGSIICPTWYLDIDNPENNNVSGDIKDIYTAQNPQWFKIKENKEVDHLHCSFLYRAGIAEYNLNLSKVAHREETLFTYQLKQKGYSIIVVQDATSYHLKSAEGGIREGHQELYGHDEEIFRQALDCDYLVILDNGIGDHIVFASLMAELLKKHNKITMACCYHEVFEEYKDSITHISLDQAKLITNLDGYNIYKKMSDWNWTNSLQDAFRRMYT
jgi:hypothetical protein